MKSIRYQLLGIGFLLFAFCPYVIGITTGYPPAYMFAGICIQIVGIILVIIGFGIKD